MNNQERILIIQTAFLGDVVLTIPMIMALRRGKCSTIIRL